MRHLVPVLSMTTFVLAACGSDGPSDPPPSVTGTITGSVIDVDSGGSGMAGVSVSLQGSAGTQTVTTTSGGGFSLANAAVGSWQASLQVPGTHLLESGQTATRTVSVTAGQTATVEPFRLVRPRGTVTGSVELDGVGVASGGVSATRGGFSNRNATPAASGAFDLELAAGAWTLIYTPGTGHQLVSGETGTRTVTVVADQTVTVSPFEIAVQSTPSVVEIHLTQTSEFSPASVSISPGTTVRWINDAAIEHTITPENASQPGVWQRQTTSTAGVVFEHQFNEANQTYRYRCEPHSSNFETGMVGVITVTGG
jgi:plastocyanin